MLLGGINLSTQANDKKLDKANRVTKVSVALFVLVLIIGFFVLPFFGVPGLYKVLKNYGFVKITFADSLASNLIYFAFFCFIIYLITLVLDLVSKMIVLFTRMKFTTKTMVLNYLSQSLLGTFIFKGLLGSSFERINLSLSGTFLCLQRST